MAQRRKIEGWHRMPVLEKERVTRLSAPPALWRCRVCGVKVLGRDQAGHTAREHAGASHGWDMVTS
jgi:ribosomal protein L37AE/L43A